MRITTGILTKEALAGYQRQMRGLDEARRRAATGVRVHTASDDPVAASGTMQASSALRALEQHRSNLERGQSRLSMEDSVLEQLGGVLMRAQELAAAQAGDPADARARDTARAEVDRLIEFTTDLANTRMAGSYLFGGQYADTPPLQNGAPDPARPASGSALIEIGEGTFIETTHGAQEIFVDSGVMDALSDLSAALDADDPTGVQTAMTALDDAFQAVQEIVGDLGARMSQLDVTASNLDSLEVTLAQLRSDLSDANLAEAVTELVDRQGSLEAAMLANSRILNITLADYLR